MRVGPGAVARDARENRRSAPARLVLLLEKKEPRPLAQREAVARDVERPGNGRAERAQRVEAREDEGRNGVGPTRENPGSAPLSNPFRGEPDRGRARRAGDGNRRDGAARAVPFGELASESARIAPGKPLGSAGPRREPLREGTVSGERRPDGDSRAGAAERQEGTSASASSAASRANSVSRSVPSSPRSSGRRSGPPAAREIARCRTA